MRLASLQLVIAQSAGVKINGRRPKLTDFLPKYAREEEDDWVQREMAAAAIAIAKQQHGQS